jgi:hypothetical protein
MVRGSRRARPRRGDVAEADIIVATMLFLDEHIRAILPALEARRPHCDALVGCISGAEVARLTKLGRLDMSRPATGVMGLLKRLRGGRGKAPRRARARCPCCVACPSSCDTCPARRRI